MQPTLGQFAAKPQERWAGVQLGACRAVIGLIEKESWAALKSPMNSRDKRVWSESMMQSVPGSR